MTEFSKNITGNRLLMRRTASLPTLEDRHATTDSSKIDTLRRSNSFRFASESKPSSPSTFLPLGYARLHLALHDKRQAEVIAIHELNKKYLLLSFAQLKAQPGIKNVSISALASLETIFQFTSSLHTFCRHNADVPIVIYSGAQIDCQIHTIFLLGCHLLMIHDCTEEDLLSMFHGTGTDLPLDGGEFSLRDYWGALATVRDQSWLTFKESFNSPTYDSCIDIEEYLHYARFVSTRSTIVFTLPGCTIIYKKLLISSD